MAESESRVPNRASPFKNASEADRRLAERLVLDRTSPNAARQPSGEHIDVQALADVFRRNVRDVSDVANIFKVMPDLNLPRDILVSAICSPGDLATTTLIFEGKVQGSDAQLTSMLIDRLEEAFLKEKETHNKVHNWIDEALILRGAHPILIIPEASLDRMINGDEDASMESVASFNGEWQGGWFKPKGFLGVRVKTSNGDEFASFESMRRRFDHGTDMAEYHTIKAEFGATLKERKSLPLPIRVTDNLAVLRTPAVQEVKRLRATAAAFGEPALESRRRERMAREREAAAAEEANANPEVKGKGKQRNVPDSQIYSRFFRKPQSTRKSRMEVVPTLKQVGGKTVGHPIEFHLPTQAVVPVCVPGDPENHIGYWVINDGNGFPVASVKTLDYYDDVRRGMLGGGEQVGSGNQIAGELLNMAAGAIQGGIANASDIHIDRMAELCGAVIERDLVARLKNGILGGDFELARTDHINKLMLARTLKNQLTTLLYVPADMMIYMAYDYNEYGVGKSILEDAKGLCAMRANLQVAHVMGSIANAIPGKDINIELDPADKDPTNTVGFLVNEAMALAFNQLPMSINSPQGIAEALQMTSYSVNVEGHPRFPGIKTTITPRESQQVAIDSETLQQARDDVTRVFSVTPEMVDNMNQPEFATTAVNNSLLLLKRVMMVQRQTNPMLTDYVRIYTMHDGYLVDDLLDIIENNKKWLPKDFEGDPEIYLQEFLNNLTVKLPAPDIDNLEKHMELYDKYEQFLDKAIAAYIKDEYLDGYASNIKREAIPTIVATWKGVQLRNFMRTRGIFRELDIFGNGEDGSPLYNMNEDMKAYAEALDAALAEYSKVAAKDAKRRSDRWQEISKLDEEARAAAEAQPLDSEGGLDGLDGGTPPQDEEPDDGLMSEPGETITDTSDQDGGDAGNQEDDNTGNDADADADTTNTNEEEEEAAPADDSQANAKQDDDEDAGNDGIPDLSLGDDDLPPAPKV